jgi:CheY-like chemotaxis protein
MGQKSLLPKPDFALRDHEITKIMLRTRDFVATSCYLKDEESIAMPEKPSPSYLQSMRVLVVEDSPDNRVLIGLFLKSAGIQKIDYALNGQEGVEKATHENYDVVLMDLNMPVMDGYAATTKLREEGFNRPIIALTANNIDLPRAKSNALKLGFNEYLTKPIDRRVLVENLKRFHSS